MTVQLPMRTIAVNGVELAVVDEGSGPLVVLCHGFPELAFSWRHQVPALVDAGYRVLAPDQRGYGRSSRPDAITDYDIEHLTGDLTGLLDELGEERAVFVGHDWGSMVVWSLALRAPERVAGVVGMSVPFLPRTPAPPVQMMRNAFGDTFFYMVYFQQPGIADANLGADPATTMRRFLGGATTEGAPDVSKMFAPYGDMGMVERMPEPKSLPAWLTQQELDVYVDEFTRTGFTGPINWYRNMDRNWELNEPYTGKVTMPAFFITGASDPVRMMAQEGGMEEWVPDLRGTVVIEGAGHWVQQEKPAEVNAALLSFLRTL